MTDPITRSGEGAKEPGQVAYEARFAHLPPRHVEPWDGLDPEAKAIWKRVERASVAAAEASLSALRERVVRLEEALKSILPGRLCGEIDGVPDENRTTIGITFGQIRAGRRALAPVETGGEDAP